MDNPILFGDLEKYCFEKQSHCRELAREQSKSHALKAEGERREGMQNVQSALVELRVKIDGIEQQLLNKNMFILPPKILYFLLAGFTGVGLAGRDAIGALLKWFGVSP